MDTNENTNQEKNPLNELEEKVIENRTDSPKSGQKRKKIINIISIIIGVVASMLTIPFILAFVDFSDPYKNNSGKELLLFIVISVPIGVVFRLISRWAISIVVGLFVKTNIILRVIFGLLLLLFIVWGIWGHPLSSGHLLLQYSLGRRDFGGIECNGWNLFSANLEEANLSDVNLKGAKLSLAKLSGADLSGADLNNADLRHADLIGVDLNGADLSVANLRGADLSGADLFDVNLSEANLSGADLSGANVIISELSNVYRLQCATMPNGMTYDGHLNLTRDLDIAKNFKNIDINDDEAMAEFYCVSLEEYIQGQERDGSD